MTGYVGAAITRALFHTDHELIGLVRQKDDLPEEVLDKYKIVKADISRSVPKIECDLVIHCAAWVSEKVLAVIMNKTNVEGTRRVLDATPPHTPVIHLSSGSVYNLTEVPHVETDSIAPKLLTPYGRSKYLAEQIVINEYTDRKRVIIRPRAVYGRGDKVILPRLLSIYKDGRFKVPGDLNQTASMTHIDLLVDVVLRFIDIVTATSHPLQADHLDILNVADFQSYNLRENITGLFAKLFKRDIEIKSMNETVVRLVAGMRQVLVPGNQYTQTSIDYLTRDHVLNTDKLQSLFPDLQSRHFLDIIPEYVQWIHSVGLSNISARDKRIVWM